MLMITLSALLFPEVLAPGMRSAPIKSDDMMIRGKTRIAENTLTETALRNSEVCKKKFLSSHTSQMFVLIQTRHFFFFCQQPYPFTAHDI